MMSYEFSYMAEELLGTGILSALISGIPSGLFGIATYVLTSMALYTMAQRRGLNRPWLAWIPVVNCWILGSLSDQYRYVVKGQIRSKRKVLLVLNILMAVLTLAMVVTCGAMAVNVVSQAMRGSVSQGRMMELVLRSLVSAMGLCLPLVGVSVALAVIRYMALYDVYRSVDPANCVLFLVLSICFRVTEPFFLFFNRNKDLGMPPRRNEAEYREPVFDSVQTEQEPWQQKDYEEI